MAKPMLKNLGWLPALIPSEHSALRKTYILSKPRKTIGEVIAYLGENRDRYVDHPYKTFVIDEILGLGESEYSTPRIGESFVVKFLEDGTHELTPFTPVLSPKLGEAFAKMAERLERSKKEKDSQP